MRSVVLSLLVAGQLALGAQPALAAAHVGSGFGPGEHTRVGVFGGFQIKVPLGGSRAKAPSASLGIAPVVRSQSFDGAGRTRIGEGLLLRMEPNRPAEFRLAGTRLDRLGLTPNGQAPGGQRAGVSTLGWIAIGVGVTVVLVVAAGAICLSDSDCIPDDD